MTPFLPFKNTTLTFEVDDPLQADQVDSAGNPRPGRKQITIEAFMKRSRRRLGTDSANINISFAGIDLLSDLIEGFVVSDGGRIPEGITANDRTVYAKYRDQEGIFILLIGLQSSVKAELITGDSIAGLFQVAGGT
jgi:hypothetical protein